MNYGHYGRDLLLELKRSDKESISAYNDATVTACLEDLTLHVQEMQDLVAAAAMNDNNKLSQESRPSLLLQEAAIRRNKRCLLAYHWVRLQRLQQQQQDEEEEDDHTETTQHLMAPAEQDFMRDYRKLHCKYVQGLPVDDLKARFPPLNVDRVLVRVQGRIHDDDGPIVLASGQAVNFIPGATQFLLWTDVEDWVREGKLLLLQGEEEHETS